METDHFYSLISSRMLRERLLLKRNPLDYQAYIETFRESLIDANPHQIEAVVFALEKLDNGGCILADEVGLGKTIEAGLIISQYRARRSFNILILVPTSLAGQWNSELRKLFQIPSTIFTSRDLRKFRKNGEDELFAEEGVYIMGREFASRLEKERLLRRKPWDLIIIDEAHEVFANIYRRFNARSGEYLLNSKSSATAGNLYYLLKKTPILLLTATPIQNNILELWGLASFILPEKNKNYLGKFNHFKELFIQNSELVLDRIPELKDRIGNFLIRNLRRNAQIFMKYKFTDRNCETLNFNMNRAEKALYDDISAYFERDDIFAYSAKGIIDMTNERFCGIRNLLKLSYRRALGSSFAALKLSLKGIIERLEAMKSGGHVDLETAVETDDPENDEDDKIAAGIDSNEDEWPKSEVQPVDTEGMNKEIEEVRSFIDRAEDIRETSKDKIIVHALQEVFSKPDKFYQKAVIFTTYIATQQHLMTILEANGFEDEILLFSGSARKSPRQKEILSTAIRIWEEEVGRSIPISERPAGNILARTALIHYFKTRKKILISTEAGAKGLNLQFCNVIINYDLPWNPQRIEQRIGRCHRYGQERDVLVINCINADNETEQRIYEILYNKFDLFKNVLGTGDDVLGTLSKAVNFEMRINDILNKFKTKEERLLWLQRFEEEINEETRRLKDKKLIQTRKLIDELDPHVTQRLKDIRDKLPDSFSQYDRDLLDFLHFYADYKQFSFEIQERKKEQIYFNFNGRDYYIGKRDEDKIINHEHITLNHELLENPLTEFRTNSLRLNANICFDYSTAPGKSAILKPYIKCSGKWHFTKIAFSGLEEEERLKDIMILNSDGGIRALNSDEINALKSVPFHLSDKGNGSIDDEEIEQNLNRFIEKTMHQIQNEQQPRIDKKIHNMEIELKDMEDYLRKAEQEMMKQIDEVDRKIKNTFNREEGKKLIKQKAALQSGLTKIRKDLLEFQNEFAELSTQAQLDLVEKRFIDTKTEEIFSLNFEIE